MALEKHFTLDVTSLNVLQIVCTICQAAITVPVGQTYQPPEHCLSCRAAWFSWNAPPSLAFQSFMAGLALVREHMPKSSARIQFVIPASE
jgi:hypothetical protein